MNSTEQILPEHVAVVVPVYGSLEDVAELLEPLVGERVPHAEKPGAVIIVDDCYPGSVDQSVLPESATYHRRQVNGGFGAAVNTGIDLAEGFEYVLVLNSDLTLPEGFLKDLLEDAAPWLPAVVGCRNVDEEGHSGFAARFFPSVSQQVIEWLVPLASQRHRDLLHRAVGHDLNADRTPGMHPVDWVSGSMMLLPRQHVVDAGGFDESFFMYTEEVDLQKRLHERGILSVFDADLAVKHVGGGSSGGEDRRRRWLTNARDLYARKHLNPRALRLGLRAATEVNFLWNSMRQARGKDVNAKQVRRFELDILHGAKKFNSGHPGEPDSGKMR